MLIRPPNPAADVGRTVNLAGVSWCVGAGWGRRRGNQGVTKMTGWRWVGPSETIWLVCWCCKQAIGILGSELSETVGGNWGPLFHCGCCCCCVLAAASCCWGRRDVLVLLEHVALQAPHSLSTPCNYNSTCPYPALPATIRLFVGLFARTARWVGHTCTGPRLCRLGMKTLRVCHLSRPCMSATLPHHYHHGCRHGGQ